MDEYNAGKSGGNVHIVSQAAADQLMAVVVIREKGVSSRYYGTKFDGLMEVVYDNAADSKYVIDERSLTGGAVMRAKQTIVIPEAICNGGRQPVTPDPEPEPEYIEVKGAPYTYCFEDGWPWIGDYDMNDVVVVVSVDRRSDKETGKVELIRINWELKAAGAAHLNAFAVQLDKVRASEVAGVETTNTTFGRGCVCGLRPRIGQRTGRDPAFQHIAGDPGRRDLHQYDQGRGHTDRETHDDGDLCAAGRPRSRPRIGAQCVHRCEPEEFGHVHPREGDPHTGAQADAIRGRIGQHLPGVGSLPLFRHQGRRCEEQLHDVGAVYPGRVPLSARTQRYPGCLYIFQRMGCIGRPGNMWNGIGTKPTKPCSISQRLNMMVEKGHTSQVRPFFVRMPDGGICVPPLLPFPYSNRILVLGFACRPPL